MKNTIIKALLILLLIPAVILTVLLFSGAGFSAMDIAAIFVITLAALFTVNMLGIKKDTTKGRRSRHE